MSRKPNRPAPSETDRRRIVAYIRVSTDKQAEHGVSLDAQRAKVEQYAALYDLELVAVEVDALSAKTTARPALARALAMLDAGTADGLLVVKLDRLTRSVRDLGDLIERYFGARGSSLISVSENVDTRTAAGRLVLNVLASVGQWEREAIGERTSAAMQHKKAVGETTGTAPYGFRVGADGVRLEEDAAEQRALALVRELRAEGLSLRAIGDRLTAAGLTPRSGKAWHPQTVARIADAVAA
jgi:DNA invertase Pin-like site-specific DNA recombinase